MFKKDDVVKLIKITYEPDDNGVDRPQDETSAQAFCTIKNVSSAAFEDARQRGLRPAFAVVVRHAEYDGHQEIEYAGKRYRVFRTYRLGFDDVELTVEDVIGI